MEKVTSRVFKSGNSQAVRIPAGYRLDADEVTIEQVPGGLLLKPVEASMSEVVRRFREFQAAEGIEDGILEDPDEWLDDDLLSDDELGFR
ncbi:AbrB/MazE/SpoVT family DNA-binding domain-containing protein [Corynebacterium coyleae]|uniref:antitoxin n=1 Tax=Corynebacterium coyleae TaxID=53374 RepID=UPI00255196C5|nr:AbrB/MazE/SpoVT family DNA-binding domain-containing protein [Corynebacterium coyleae]MDK6493591.1 AbrB/MazE/SpoVT family DNA-binding domain-containing protein [Corynebacterium coyleae]MDK8823835.1 AbrB/MazE/SpoVT family DNA-binding domain-containing protein [Corynebacterium coyleae]